MGACYTCRGGSMLSNVELVLIGLGAVGIGSYLWWRFWPSFKMGPDTTGLSCELFLVGVNGDGMVPPYLLKDCPNIMKVPVRSGRRRVVFTYLTFGEYVWRQTVEEEMRRRRLSWPDRAVMAAVFLSASRTELIAGFHDGETPGSCCSVSRCEHRDKIQTERGFPPGTKFPAVVSEEEI